MSKSRLRIPPRKDPAKPAGAPPPIETAIGVRVYDLLRQYSSVVDASDLAASSKAMYIDFATYFVRWMTGDFEPGKVGARHRQEKPFRPGVENNRK